MNTRTLLVGSLSALVLGGPMVGCAAGGGHVASASSVSGASAAKTAANDAAKAKKALAARKPDEAVRLAEAAVGLMPQEAAYRALLGQSYLTAGRFVSARAALGDAIGLSPDDGRVALNLVLAQIATGDWATARATLEEHAALIPASDRGLALALAGDPAGGVALLTAAARSEATSAKVRQNLGLALALAGQWQAARAVAAADLAPGEVDRRMEQWAAFAQPAQASDQVAALLGVRAVADAGQPVALALNAPVAAAQATAIAASEPVAPVLPAEAAPAPAPVEIAAAEPVVAAAVQPGVPAVSNIAFGPRAEVVQPLPARLLTPARGPAKLALAKAAAPGAAWTPNKGGWFVQIGAFESAAVARDAWSRASRRMPALADHAPNGMTFAARAGQVYRLSVGGFARADADRLCQRYRASGGTCFVRAGAGDQIAKWVRPGGVEVAAR